MATITLKKVPPKTDENYMSIVIENVITAYKVFLSDSMSLDYCAVSGKTRALIMEDKEYRIRTRQLRAERYLKELEEIEQITNDLQGTIIDETDYDMRDTKQKQEYEKNYKDTFNMKLKAAEMRRDLLNMTKKDDEKEEADALNIFFIALTAEEFRQMRTVEVQDGDENAREALKDEITKEGPAAARSIMADVLKDEATGGYKINQDGSVEDF